MSDVSDDGDDTDGNTTNDPTVVQTTSDVSIEVTKSRLMLITIATVRSILAIGSTNNHCK